MILMFICSIISISLIMFHFTIVDVASWIKYLFLGCSISLVLIPIGVIIRSHYQLFPVLFKSFEYCFMCINIILTYLCALAIFDDIYGRYFWTLWFFNTMCIISLDISRPETRIKMMMGMLPGILFNLYVYYMLNLSDGIPIITRSVPYFNREFNLNIFMSDRLIMTCIFIFRYMYSVYKNDKIFMYLHYTMIREDVTITRHRRSIENMVKCGDITMVERFAY